MTDTPKRIQRKRTKGWKMPPNTVYVGRPGPWENPFVVGTKGVPDRKAAVALFRKEIEDQQLKHGIIKMNLRSSLRGKNLACWCPLDQPCHADVLLEIANK